MTQRITEDIRFYLPADPYYYQVDNLPLEDLLTNDVRLQSQIDAINSADRGNTVGRAGFTELQPFIDAGIPGTISVRPGNFIGRVQRGFGSGAGAYRNNNGRREMNNPPTTFGSGDNPTGTYSVHNPPNHGTNASEYVGRTALFNFKGANISIDSFDFDAFEWTQTVNSGNSSWTTPPLGRIDLIGITTVNGAMDDANVPGNQSNEDGAQQGTGLPKLAVVKGAGIVQANNGTRQVVIGEKYITIGTPQDRINDYGRDLEGNVVPNPEFGTVPMPDDVVNVNFARNIVANGEIAQSLNDWSLSNKNASFFLPVAYVYVPQSHVEGNPIPEQHMSDIRPFFRTAELALAERQAVAASLSPSVNNPFVTEEHAKAISLPITQDLEQQIADLKNILRQTKVRHEVTLGARRITNLNNVRGARGWTRVTPEQMGLAGGFGDNQGYGGQLPADTVAIRVAFFGFISGPDSGSTLAYMHAAGFDPNNSTNYGTLEGKVLSGRASSSGDAVSDFNTCLVPVDSGGNFYYSITGPGWNNGAYADVQGYVTEKTILD
tara:strand:- start:51 stop:1694 length:1644 start_codon:yes stop_codon:yes gene_type:complete